jgi:hypothetical protein
MRNIQLASGGRVRVWIAGGVALYTGETSLRATIDSHAKTSLSLSGVTIEALIPRGARAQYGMVGATFEPTRATATRVEVPYSADAGGRWSESIAAQIDDVRIGLPSEYASAVFDAIVCGGKGGLPDGHLKVAFAAHGMVGSSPEFFAKLTTCVLDMMRVGCPGDDELLAAFLSDRLVG